MKNIATGKVSGERIVESGECKTTAFTIHYPFSTIHYSSSTIHYAQRAFTLLELVIVITIMIVLLLAIAPMYNRSVDIAREATLRADLMEMRKTIDRYTADKGEQPPSLQALVEAGYLREIPVDPMTDQADWYVEMGNDATVSKTANGVKDVRSSSGETGSDGRRYSEW